MVFNIPGRGQYENVYDPATNTYKLRNVDTGAEDIGSSEGGTYSSSTGQIITRAQAMQSGQIDKPGEAVEKLRSIGGGLSTTQIEQRFGIEEALKRGEITRQEAITLTKQNLEGRPLQIFRQVQQEQQIRTFDVAALQDFRERTGRLSPVGRGYREATKREEPKYTPERVYVKIGGRNVPFVSREKAEQQRPIARLEQAIHDKNVELSNVLKYDLPEKIPKPITNFFDAIDKRAELSFKGKKPLNPFALRNVAEAFYNIEKGMVKGVVEEPLTAGISLVVGGALTKGAGVLSARFPILSRSIVPELKTASKGQKISLYRAMFGAPKGVPLTEPVIAAKLPSIGAGKATKYITTKLTPLNIAGGAMAGYYGADVATRIKAANNRNETIGKILSTEIIPFAAGARLSQVPISLTAKNIKYQTIRAARDQRKVLNKFVKDETARLGTDVWSKIPTQRQSALKRGEELKRTIQYGKTFVEPKGKGVAVTSGRQQLIAIQETKLKPPELKQVQVTVQKQTTKQLQQQIQVTQQEQIQVLKQLQKTILLLPMVQRQKIRSVQKDQQVQKQVLEQKQVRKQIYKQFTPQLLKISTSQIQSQQQKSIQEIRQVQKKY